MTHNCTNVPCCSRASITTNVIPVPRHWDPENLIANKYAIQHF
nr:WPE palindromic element domain-containing protein [Wolbachia endosymbiont (group A) of Volucella inflata]